MVKIDYLDNYVQAVRNPLPKLATAFKREKEYLLTLLKNLSKGNSIIDLGCGIARPLDFLAQSSKSNINFYGIDNNKGMIKLASQKTAHLNNTNIILGDFLQLPFEDEFFNISYSTYNTLGSLNSEERKEFVTEQKRVTKKGGKIINITWNQNEETTRFLEKYYPFIGIKIRDINNERAITNKGVFNRLSVEDIISLYNLMGVKDIEVTSIGSIWVAICGVKI